MRKTPRRIVLPRLMFLLSLTPTLAFCQAGNKPPPPARPEGVASAVALDHFQELLGNSPFRRLLSLSDNLVLSGVGKLPSGTVVTVMNRDTNETYTVSAEENAQGWKLLEVIGGRSLEEVEAKISVGKETVTIRFDRRRLRPENMRRGGDQAKPAQAPEKPSVEQWLARLNPVFLKTFDDLPDPRKEQFRSVFANYLDEYPEASSELRRDFARSALDGIKQKAASEQAEQQKQLNLQELKVQEPPKSSPIKEDAPLNPPEPSQDQP